MKTCKHCDKKFKNNLYEKCYKCNGFACSDCTQGTVLCPKKIVEKDDDDSSSIEQERSTSPEKDRDAGPEKKERNRDASPKGRKKKAKQLYSITLKLGADDDDPSTYFFSSKKKAEREIYEYQTDVAWEMNPHHMIPDGTNWRVAYDIIEMRQLKID